MIRRLLGDAALYTLSNVLVRGLGLVLLPVYVRVLSKEDYGRFDLLTVIGSVAAVVVTLEVSQGVMRYVADSQATDDERNEWVATGFWVTVAMVGLFAFAIAVVARPVADFVLGDSSHAGTLISATGWYAATAVVYFWTVVCRATLRARQAAAIALVSGLMVGGGGLLGVQLWSGVEGLVAGNLMGQTCVAAGVTVLLRARLAIRPSKPRAEALIRFSTPLVISSLALVLGLYVDRFLVRGFLGLEELAIYGVSARLASGVGLLLVGLQSALTPLVYAHVDDSNLGQELARLFRWYVVAAVAVGLALGLAARPVVTLVAGSDYAAASGVLDILVLSTLVRGSYIFFPGLFVAKRTGVIAGLNVLALVVGLAVAWVTIPQWGLSGAALAAVISGLTSVLPTYLLGQRHLAVPVWPWRRVVPPSAR